MVTPQEIKKKALAKYRTFCKAYLNNEDFFPLEIPCDKGKASDPFLKRKQAIELLLSQCDEQKKFGYTLDWDTIDTRKNGPQGHIKSIYFKNIDHFLNFIGKKTDFAAFVKNLSLVRETLPELEEWLESNIAFLQTNPRLWPNFLKVCQWFIDNPNPGIYLREIPLDIHTKFIEENRKVLKSLLDFLLPPNCIDSTTSDFSRRYGLKWDEPLVRCRYLENGKEMDFAKPISLFCEDEIPGAEVVIIENKTNFLSFPLTQKRIVLWGSGFAAAALKGITWLMDRPIYYWGDIDPPGFEILSVVRSFFPQTQSFLMDFETYRNFKNFAVAFDSKQNNSITYLNNDELEIYDYLIEHSEAGRLEQERVTQDYVKKSLKKIHS